MSHITNASHNSAVRRRADAEDVNNYYQLKRQVETQRRVIANLEKKLKEAQALIDAYGRAAL
jgi:hypothetical protein